VTVIAVLSAVALAENGKLKSNRLVVDVTAQQFAWHFAYPQYGGFKSNELRLVEGRQVELRLRSLDVIHSFWVPEFRQKQDAVPGIVTSLPITPTKVGTRTLVCAELCGLGHALMRATVIVMSRDDFDRWARSQQQGSEGTSG
jgi:cytochrome c oxidase subunit 2